MFIKHWIKFLIGHILLICGLGIFVLAWPSNSNGSSIVLIGIFSVILSGVGIELMIDAKIENLKKESE